MGYVLGVDLGTSRTAAAVFRNARADIVPLSDHAATMPSMVFVRETAGSGVLVGDAARRRGQEDPIRLAREFKRRFGDATPLVLGEARYTAEQLTAILLRHVVDFVAQREGGPPDQVVVAHPANWGEYRRELLRREVANAGLPPARLVSEPDAAAVHFASGERMAVGDTIAVYDLGGGTFDAAVLRRTATGFAQIGEPKGIERLGGVDFDESVLAHVTAESGLDAATLTDADMPALVRLRDDCQDAKEALSDDLEATVPVNVGAINTRVQITRAQFEQMIRSPLRSAAQTLRTAVVDAGLQLDQISAVLMVGGSSRIPLAAALVREELHRPVVFTSNPKEAVALGAARIGGGPTATAVDAPVVPPPPPAVRPPTPVPAPPPPPPPPPIAATTPTAPIAATAARTTMPPTPGTTHREAPPRTARRWWLVAVAAVVAIAVGVGVGFAVSGSDDKQAAPTTTDETVRPTDETTPATDSVAPATDATATTTAPPTTTPTATAAPTTAIAVTTLPVDLYSPISTFGLFTLRDEMVPPDSQSTPIPDGAYLANISFDVPTSALTADIHPFFLNQACVTAAEADGNECEDGLYSRDAPLYTVPVSNDAFVSVNAGQTDQNFQVDTRELATLVNTGSPSAGAVAPDGFFFSNLMVVDVVGGVATRVNGLFTP